MLLLPLIKLIVITSLTYGKLAIPVIYFPQTNDLKIYYITIQNIFKLKQVH